MEIQLTIAFAAILVLAVRVFRLERALVEARAAPAAVPAPAAAEEPIPAEILVEIHLAVLGLLPPALGERRVSALSVSRRLRRRAHRAGPASAVPMVSVVAPSRPLAPDDSALPAGGRFRGRGAKGLRSAPRLSGLPLAASSFAARVACPA